MLKTFKGKKSSHQEPDRQINNVHSLETSMEMNVRLRRQSQQPTLQHQHNWNRRRQNSALDQQKAVDRSAKKLRGGQKRLGTQFKGIEMEMDLIKDQEQENIDRISNVGRADKRNSCTEMQSAISILKKEARLIEIEDRLGTIQKMSHLEPKILENITNEVLYDNNFTVKPYQRVNNFSMVSVCQNRHKASTNMRKVAKGRPVLYNWVRKYKKEITDMKISEEFKGRYQTEILSNSTIPNKGNEKKVCKNSCSYKFMAQVNPSCEEAGLVRTGYRNGRIRTATFLERLKKLEDRKQAQTKQFEPVFSYNQKFYRDKLQKSVQQSKKELAFSSKRSLRNKLKTDD